MIKRLFILIFIVVMAIAGSVSIFANTVAFPMIEDFEDNNLSATPAWTPSGLSLATTTNTAAGQGNYSLQITGNTTGWYVGYASAFIGHTPDDFSAYTYLHLYIYNGGQVGDSIKIEIYDNDNANWNVNVTGNSTTGDDIWYFTKTLDWTGAWKEVFITLNGTTFTDSNSGIGNDIFDLAPPDAGSPAVTMLGFAVNSASQTGTVNLLIDSIHCSSYAANNAPNSPSLAAPYSNEQFVTNNPTLRWQGFDIDNDRLTYNVYVSSNASGLSLLASTGNLLSNSNSTTIDSFEDNNTNYGPTWSCSSAALTITTSASNGYYAMQISGQASGYYVDYVNAYIATSNDIWSAANYLRLMVYNSGVTGDSFAVEIVDNDNNNWSGDDTGGGAGDDRWRYNLVMDWRNYWKEIFIPLKSSSWVLNNAGVGDGIFNLGLGTGNSPGVVILALVVNSTTATGSVKFAVDSIQLSDLAEVKVPTPLEYGLTYYWKIVALDSNSATASSITGTFTTAKLENTPPDNIAYTYLSKANDQLILQWSASYDNYSASSDLRYFVYRSGLADFSTSENIAGNLATTSATVTMSSGATVNYYMVKAKDQSQNFSVSSNLGVSLIFTGQASANTTTVIPIVVPKVNYYSSASGIAGIVSTANIASIQALNPINNIIEPYFYSAGFANSWGGVDFNLHPTWNYQAILRKGSNQVSINLTGAQ